MVELMLVVIIIGLLAILTIPAYRQIREGSLDANAINSLRQFVSAGRQYMIEQAHRLIGLTLFLPTWLPSLQTTPHNSPLKQ